MKLNRFSFALGIAFALILVGCMVAATNVNNSAGARFEFHLMAPANNSGGTYDAFVVLDTQTGTAISWNHGYSEPKAVHNFYQEDAAE